MAWALGLAGLDLLLLLAVGKTIAHAAAHGGEILWAGLWILLICVWSLPHLPLVLLWYFLFHYDSTNPAAEHWMAAFAWYEGPWQLTGLAWLSDAASTYFFLCYLLKCCVPSKI